MDLVCTAMGLFSTSDDMPPASVRIMFTWASSRAKRAPCTDSFEMASFRRLVEAGTVDDPFAEAEGTPESLL